MNKAMPPLDLLREIRKAFEHDATELREKEKQSSGLEARALGLRAFAAEAAVKKIDATLRDWG
jgi:hypothetical protein